MTVDVLPSSPRSRKDTWLTIPATAEIVGVHPRTMRRYIRDGKIPATRLSSQVVRIRLSDLDALLKSMMGSPPRPGRPRTRPLPEACVEPVAVPVADPVVVEAPAVVAASPAVFTQG